MAFDATSILYWHKIDDLPKGTNENVIFFVTQYAYPMVGVWDGVTFDTGDGFYYFPKDVSAWAFILSSDQLEELLNDQR